MEVAVPASGRTRLRTAAVGAGFVLAVMLPLPGVSGCVQLRLLGRLNEALPEGKGKPVRIPSYKVQPLTGLGTASAGAARVDITPPPGYPNMGDSLAGGVAHGYWTRLYARAFYFEDRTGNRLVLVSTDLTVMPEGLTSKVLQLVNSSWETLYEMGRDLHLPVRKERIPVRPEELILTATHTHQGPGNFTTSKLYNAFASAYTGFDRRLFDFLATRIATAVACAASSARDVPGGVTIKLHVRADVSCHELPHAPCGYRQSYLRNRMPLVFDINPDREEVVDAINHDGRCGPRLCADAFGFPTPAHGATGPFCEPEDGYHDTVGCPRLRAVDPRMTVLEVSKSTFAGDRVIGILVFFAAHPTVLQPDAPLNSGDFAAVAMRSLEREHADGPVAGFFNGAEGDIHMRRLRRDLRDVVRLGKLFERSVLETLDSPPVAADTNPAISVRRIEVTEFAAGDPDNPGRRRRNDTVCQIPVWKNSALAPVPQYGVAALGGGEGDRTVLVELGWREGVRGQPQGGQGPKLPGLDSSVLRNLKVTDIVAPPEDFPPYLPVSYAELGPLRIGTFPVELTMTMGYRIRHLLHLDDPGPGKPGFVLVGLANSYSNYVATPDEYYAQDYVGASTIWGPQEGLALGCGLEALTTRTSGSVPVPPIEVPSQVFYGGPPKCFGPGFTGDSRTYPTEELERILLRRDGLPAVDLPWFEWTEDAGPVCETKKSPDFPMAARRRVSIDIWNGAQWVSRSVGPTWDNDGTHLPDPPLRSGPPPADDDTGHNLLTLLMGIPGDAKTQRTWATIWAAELFETGIDTKLPFRFHVYVQDGHGKSNENCSKRITLDDWKELLRTQRATGGKPGPLEDDQRSCR